MEYQHLVFEEFARKVQPAVRPFHVYSPDINPAIDAEFAHAVYRFGHSMLDDQVARQDANADGIEDGQLAAVAQGVPESTGVLQQLSVRPCSSGVHAGAGRRLGPARVLGRDRQRDRRVRHRDPAQQPARSAARPAVASTWRGPATPASPRSTRRAASSSRRPTTVSWRRTRAGATSVSTSSTPSR